MTRLLLLLALAVGGCATGPVGADEARVLRLGHGLSTDHPVHVAMQAMAARVSAPR